MYRATRVPDRQIATCRLRGYHPLWLDFPDDSAKLRLFDCRLMPPHQVTGPTTPLAQRRQAITHKRFRLFPVRSPLLGESFLLSFPPGTKMFQFPGLPRQSYGFTLPSRDMTPEGFPHSDSRGSTSVGDSSRTIVASHVLLRLLAPRYPPKALCSLTTLALSFDLILQRSFGLLQMSSALGPLLHPLTNEQIYRFLLCRDLDKRSRRASYAVFKVQNRTAKPLDKH